MLFHENSQHTRVMHLKYKAKYKQIKRQIKNLVFENASLADEVAQVQADLYASREERRYLAKRLLRFGVEESNVESSEATPSAIAPKKRGPKKRAPNGTGQSEKRKPRTPRDKTKTDVSFNSVLSVGEIIPVNPNFHNEHSIYPCGYVATRVFAHPHDPRRKCVYTCKILNNSGRPQFQIIPDNDLDSVFFGDNADICHQQLLEAIQRALGEIVTPTPLTFTVQGDRFFGLENNMVKALLQMDPAFGLCANFKGFLTRSGSFVLPEDKDPALCFDALQKIISTPAASYHIMPEVKNEPPDELLNFN